MDQFAQIAAKGIGGNVALLEAVTPAAHTHRLLSDTRKRPAIGSAADKGSKPGKSGASRELRLTMRRICCVCLHICKSMI